MALQASRANNLTSRLRPNKPLQLTNGPTIVIPSEFSLARSQLNARTLAGIHASVSIEIRHEDHGSLAEYAATPPAFEVREAIDKVIIGRPPSPLPRRAVSPACRKDYDAIPGNGPGGCI